MFRKLKESLHKTKYKMFKDKRIALVKLDGVIVDSAMFPVP